MEIKKEIEIKVGQKFELAENQPMWLDPVSKVSLRAPSKSRVTRPKDLDYRSQLEWFQSNRTKNLDKMLYKEDPGLTWFEVTKDMDTTNIKRALKKGTLVPLGEIKESLETKQKSIFKADKDTGFSIYDGPDKNIYKLLQKNKEKDLIDVIEKIRDLRILEVMLEMEQKGWNPAASPRGYIIEAIEKQLKNAEGVGLIKEEESETSTIKEEIQKAKKSK